jgi:hypothetical protein
MVARDETDPRVCLLKKEQTSHGTYLEQQHPATEASHIKAARRVCGQHATPSVSRIARSHDISIMYSSHLNLCKEAWIP